MPTTTSPFSTFLAIHEYSCPHFSHMCFPLSSIILYSHLSTMAANNQMSGPSGKPSALTVINNLSFVSPIACLLHTALVHKRIATLPVLVSPKQIPRINLPLHIVQAAIITIRNNRLALFLEFFKIIYDHAAKEGGAIF